MDVKELVNQWSIKIKPILVKYQMVLVVICVGLLLMLWPNGGEEAEEVEELIAQTSTSYFDVDALEEKLQDVLSQIDGAGEVRVILTVDSSAKQIVAQDGETVIDGEEREQSVDTVIISQASGAEGVVPIQELAPEFRGALVVCSGGDNSTVRLQITQAVSAVTGLSTDKIAVCAGD